MSAKYHQLIFISDRRDSEFRIAFVIVSFRPSHLSRFFLSEFQNDEHVNFHGLMMFCIIRAIGRIAACLSSRPFARDGPLYDLRGFYHAPRLLGNHILDYLQQTHLHYTPRGKERFFCGCKREKGYRIFFFFFSPIYFMFYSRIQLIRLNMCQSKKAHCSHSSVILTRKLFSFHFTTCFFFSFFFRVNAVLFRETNHDFQLGK